MARRAGNSEDPTVAAAKVNRSSAIVSSVITGVVAIVVAAIPSYTVGKQAGKAAAAPATVIRTVTRTVTASDTPASGSAPGTATGVTGAGAVSLRELPQNIEPFTWGAPYVGGQRKAGSLFGGIWYYPRATFDLGGKFQTFHAVVALADSTLATNHATLTVAVDGAVQKKPVTVGKGDLKEITATVAGGQELELSVEASGQVSGHADQLVLIDPVLRK